MPVYAIYARVSDESQAKGDSIEHQIDYCKEVARRKSVDASDPWLTRDELVYVDRGITGTSILRRTEIKRMIADARQGMFQVVLFKGISRFARDTVDALLMLRTLLGCGVRVVSMEENYDSARDNAEFVFTIHSALAQAESEKTAIRVRLGAMQKARRGQWNGKPPDGYMLNPATKHLEIDPLYAPIVHEVFALYESGYGARKIAHRLNERGTRTKAGNPWTPRTILRMLTNPAYVGDVAYGRRQQRFTVSSERDLLTRRKTTRWTDDKEEIVLCKEAHPAIVERRTFERVAAKLASRRHARGRSGELHLLSAGLLQCKCGGSMVVKYNARGIRYYRCASQANYGRSHCQQPFLRADEVETVVLDALRAEILSRIWAEDWASVVSMQFRSLTQIKWGEKEPTDGTLQATRQQIEKVLRASQYLVEQLAKGNLSELQFTSINDNYRKQLDALQTYEAALTQTSSPFPKDSDLPHDSWAYMRRLLSGQTPDAHCTRQLLELLVSKIAADGHDIELAYRFRLD